MKILATSLTAALLLIAGVVVEGAAATPTRSDLPTFQSRQRLKHRSSKHHFNRGPRVANAVRLENSPRRHDRGPRTGTGSPESPAAGEGTPKPKPTPERTPTPTPPPAAPEPITEPAPAPGTVVFGSGFEGSFAGWHVQSLSGRAAINGANPFAGTGAGRFEVRSGDVEPETGSNRSEVSGPTFDEVEEIYVRDEIRVPSAANFNCPWQIIDQLHETDWGKSPGIAVFLNNDRSLTLGAGDSSPIYWRGPQLRSDTWYDLVYHVKLSRDASVGYVEVWLDGEPQLLTNGSTRAYGETIQTEHTYFKAGIYRAQESTGISIVEHDDIAIGTSLAAVMNF